MLEKCPKCGSEKIRIASIDGTVVKCALCGSKFQNVVAEAPAEAVPEESSNIEVVITDSLVSEDNQG
jgi:uncharacterized Zn finger protein (UPF0148 family)